MLFDAPTAGHAPAALRLAPLVALGAHAVQSWAAGLFFTNALPNGKPDRRIVHAGMRPTRGEKWIVSQFFRSRVALNARAENVG